MTPKPVPREAVLIVNAMSRTGEAQFADAKKMLETSGIGLIAAHAIKDPSTLNDTVCNAVRSGAPMVIIGGGDGSLSGTVDDVVDKDCVFAILPLGTANSFARTLGVPLDLEGAVETIVTGQRRRIDLGMINDDYFVNAAAIGLSPMIGDTVPHKLKKYLGRIGYLSWAAWCLVKFRPFRVMLDDGRTQTRLWTTEVRIFNGRFHGGVELAENQEVDSGEILIQVVTGRSIITLMWDWYAKFFKLQSRDATTVEFRGQSFRVDTRPHHRISIDGEILARTPVIAKIAARAIEVVVPRTGAHF